MKYNFRFKSRFEKDFVIISKHLEIETKRTNNNPRATSSAQYYP